MTYTSENKLDVDTAILAYRKAPTEENRLRLLRAQEQHTHNFYQAQASEYITRSRPYQS